MRTNKPGLFSTHRTWLSLDIEGTLRTQDWRWAYLPWDIECLKSCWVGEEREKGWELGMMQTAVLHRTQQLCHLEAVHSLNGVQGLHWYSSEVFPPDSLAHSRPSPSPHSDPSFCEHIVILQSPLPFPNIYTTPPASSLTPF